MVRRTTFPPGLHPQLIMIEPALNDLCMELIGALQKAAKGLSNPTANEYHRLAWSKAAYKEAERALSTLISLGPLTTTCDEPEKSPGIGDGKGLTIKETSDWVYKCSRNLKENRWVTRVKHEDAVSIACAALHDLSHFYNEYPINYELEMPHGDSRVAKVRWVERKGDTAHLCITVSQVQPISIESRVPGPDDLDERGRCWLRRKYEPDGPTWRLFAPASLFDGALQLYYREWLPYHAIPLPESPDRVL